MESEITQVLQSLSKNRNEATERLLPVVYEELRRMAAFKLRDEASGHTLQPTALVHEAYMKLLCSIEDSWENRAHFFGAAAEAMRRILIDHARTKKRLKRGGKSSPIPLDGLEIGSLEEADDLIDLDVALEKLEKQDEVKANLVKLRFFAGLSMQQAAETLGLSLRTAERHWSFARAWLQREIREPS